MGFRFQRRIRLFPGLRVNVSKGGVSASVGRRGAWLTLGRGKVRTTVGLPGTGISYTTTSKTASSIAPSSKPSRLIDRIALRAFELALTIALIGLVVAIVEAIANR